MRSKLCVLAFVLVAGAAWAQKTNEAPEAPRETTARQDFEQTAPPSWEAPAATEAPTTEEAAPPPSAVVDAEQAEKIRQVNEALDGRKAAPEVKTPTKPERSEPGFAQLLFAFVLVLAMIFGVVYVLKRMSKVTPALAGMHLARILGKTYLAPRVALHFVKTGGKVLVVGVTQNAIAPIAEFEAEAFEAALAKPETPGKTTVPGAENAGGKADFISQLMAHLHQHRAPKADPEPEEASAPPEDPEIATLRNEIRSLRKFLDESTHETKP